MYLATTGLSEFWETDGEILFLGAWCLRQERRTEWEGLRYHVLPSPWDDRKRFYDTCAYLDESYERLLNGLTDYLNAVHQVSFNQRYWRILLGPWLLHSLHVTYDRYVCLLEAFHSYPDLRTIVLDSQSFRVPRTTMESRNWSLYDPFNLQIVSQLLTELGHEFPSRGHQGDWQGTTAGRRKRFLRQIARGVIGFVWEVIARTRSADGQVALCYLYCPPRQILELAWQTRFQAVQYEGKTDWPPPLPAPLFDERRNGLVSMTSRDGFERAFIRSLSQNFPVVYLEGFHGVREEMLKEVRTLPRVMVSAVGWWFTSEPFKFMAAEASQLGSRLITGQHGGGYGMSRYHPCEEHESRIGDSYMVWGWADQGARSCRNLPNPKLSALLANQSEHKNHDENVAILFVATDCPRYLYRFQSSPVAGHWIKYIDWERRFLESTSANLRATILFRPHQQDYGYAIKDAIAPRFPELVWDEGVPFYQRLRSTRVVVIDHPGTTLLETLVANVPTVSFWDSHHWEMRNVAEPYFESLRRVGILCVSPEAAAAKLAEIYHDPWAWWGSSEVQQARKNFADRYALAREDWADRWAKTLEEELSLTRREC